MPAAAVPQNVRVGVTLPGPHDYFTSLLARPDLFKAYDMRSPTQLTQYRASVQAQPWVTYDAGMDAAKVVIPAFSPLMGWTQLNGAIDAVQTTIPLTYLDGNYYQYRALKFDGEAMMISSVNTTTKTVSVSRGRFGTTAASHASGTTGYLNTNSLGSANQIRFPMDAVEGHSYLFTWDAYWTPSWILAGTGEKAFQFSAYSTDSIYLELQQRPDTQYTPAYTSATDVCGVTFRSYNPANDPMLNHLGVRGVDAPYVIKPNTWTRHWVRLDLRVGLNEVFDYWVADPTQIVHVYQNNASLINLTSVKKFWLEFDTSQDRYVRGNDTRDLVCYVRNLAVLQDVAVADIPFVWPL